MVSSDESNKEVENTRWKRPDKAYHGHFDCFSGAAGDMMLAACLDAAGEGEPDEQDGERLLKYVIQCICNGLPELAGEFEITCAQVWRGSGSIGAKHVNVQSIYNHKAAPVPTAAATTTKTTTTATRTNADISHDQHDHSEDHNHDHEHNHEHNHDHEHCHDHDHSHDHSHSHSHNHDDQKDAINGGMGAQEPDTTHNHSHTHAHSSDNIDHNRKHNHDHTHDSHNHDHDHGHDNGPLRNLPEIRTMLEKAPERWIPEWVRDTAIRCFTELAYAEASVHCASSADAVHFHEVGAVDSIVDMVGTLLALYALRIETVSCSRLPLGEGYVKTDHGILPVPAPATLHLMIGMPTTRGPPGWTGELVTPTGAALLRVLTRVSDAGSNNHHHMAGAVPPFDLRKVGIGAGTKNFKQHPNIIRLMVGELSSR